MPSKENAMSNTEPGDLPDLSGLDAAVERFETADPLEQDQLLQQQIPAGLNDPEGE